MSGKSRILIFGLDGATWKILKPMIRRGLMPNLKKLMDSGSSGILRSTIPPVTAPAWASFQTGVNPGKHGIYDFQTFDSKGKQYQLINANNLKVKTVWELLQKGGKTVITVNIPLSYPAKQLQGWINVGDFLAPKLDEHSVYPPEVLVDINVHGYKIIAGPLEERLYTKMEAFIEKQIDVEKRRYALTRTLMDKYNWDVLMVHNQTMDGIQHAYYPYLDPQNQFFEQSKYEIIKEFYRHTDMCIGELIEKADKDTYILVISDHGFKHIEKSVLLNVWLKRQKLLHYTKKKMLVNLFHLLSVLDVLNLKRIILTKYFSTFIGQKISAKTNASIIDWEKTAAYMNNGAVFGNIYIKDENRKEEIKRLIIEKLINLVDPENGRKVVKHIFQSEEIFSGEYVSTLPDLFVEPAGSYVFSMPILKGRKLFYKVNRKSDFLGVHEINGIFILSGEGIRHTEDQRLSIMDFAPTILALLKEPVPLYMDGKVVHENIFPGLRYSVKESKPESSSEKTEEEGDVDKREVEERLKSLGYL